ncbi:MAG: ABC transporter permease subunit [Nitrososphaeria archaeon]|jgi:ABC-type Na+ efflux pump permease subunit
MRLSKSWIIASKDFKIFFKKKNIIYSILVVPLIISFLFPALIEFELGKNGGNGIPAAELPILLPAFTFFYLILAGMVPTTIASYSLVGEKVEKSLEPLLATPTTDSEILLGKGIAAFIPPIGAILGGATIFMILMDVVTHGTLGYYFFPNWNAAIVLFLMVPLAIIMSVEWNVIVSARVSDVRVAQQIGILLMLPFAGIYVAGELDLIQLGITSNLLIIAGILLVVDLLLLYVARATFRREEILTKWK